MEINRNDLIYLFLSVILAGGSAIAIGHPNAQVGILSIAALLAIVLAVAIYIVPSLGSVVLIIAVFTNISRTVTDLGLPSVIQPLVGIVAVAIFARYLSGTRLSSDGVQTRWIETYLVFFLIVTAFSYISADNKGEAVEAILDLGKDIAIVFCIVFTLRFMHNWKQSAWAIIITTSILCLLGGYQVISGNYDQEFFKLARVFDDVGSESTTHRIAGPINEPNMWGQVVVAVVPLVLFRIIYERRLRMKVISIGILVILLFEILNTYSRGAYVALGLIVVLILLMQRTHPLVLFGAIAIAVFLLPFLPASYTARFQTLSLLTPSTQNGIYQESSFRGRTSQMLTGLNMFISNPILGVGAGNYSDNYRKYTEDLGLEDGTDGAGARDPHSLYVQILAETGILGSIAFIGFSITLLAGLSRAKKSIQHLTVYQNWVAWISAIQLSIIGYLTTSTFLHGDYLRFFWIFVALALSAIRLTEEILIESDKNHKLEIPFSI